MKTTFEKWPEIFKQIGNPDRFSIMEALHASDHLRHLHLDENDIPFNGCLSFGELLEATNIRPDTRLSYHLNQLVQTKLVEKLPFKDKNGRVYPLYKKSEKWKTFSEELGIAKKIELYIKERYPKYYVRDKS